jgi:hypothetical protein
MVSVKEAKNARCVWCAKNREGVQVSFSDGSLNAFVCWADFRKLVKARSEDGRETTTTTEKKP